MRLVLGSWLLVSIERTEVEGCRTVQYSTVQHRHIIWPRPGEARLHEIGVRAFSRT
jgi:hypothetical protein